MQARSTVPTSEGHIHQWVQYRRKGAFRCLAPYNGNRCIRIQVSQELYNLICEEWNNYIKLCQQSQSKADYEEARKYFTLFKKYKRQSDLDKLREVIKGIEKRCWVNPEYTGMMDEKKYMFKEDDYMTKPDMPDPMSPKSIYITA